MILQYLLYISHFLFVLALGLYLIQNLQWYNYKLDRVVFRHKKFSWHFIYFIFPVLIYYVDLYVFFVTFYLLYLPLLFLWYKNHDKKLVFTGRVKRFFAFLSLSLALMYFVCATYGFCQILGIGVPLIMALLLSKIVESILVVGYQKRAIKKLKSLKDLKIIAITASYGKTSIKHYLSGVLSDSFKTHHTPESVNTKIGIIQDINTNLKEDTEIYIVEAGAREKYDIAHISNLLNQHYAILGQVGLCHIEYFKNIDNIITAKAEILNSLNLQKAFIHESCIQRKDFDHEKLVVYSDKISNIKSDLNGISFDMYIDEKNEHFESNILGDFQAYNLAAVILMARELGVEVEVIRKKLKNLKAVPHRLEKLFDTPKCIIDDSFNGNLDGMTSSYELIKSFKGKKIVVTPGIIEGTDALNTKLAKKIDEVFDIVIITGTHNRAILQSNIKNTEIVILKDKNHMQEALSKITKEGDLILFSNDAPSYI